MKNLIFCSLTTLVLSGCSNCFFAGDIGNDYKNQSCKSSDFLVESAAEALDSVLSHESDASLIVLGEKISNSAGVFLVPAYRKGGFIIGGEGGKGIMLAKREDGKWASPTFHSIGGFSIGLQRGFMESLMIFVIEKAGDLRKWTDDVVTFMADTASAVGTFGGTAAVQAGFGYKGKITSYSLSKGYYLGANVSMMFLKDVKKYTQDFYQDKRITNDYILQNNIRIDNPMFLKLEKSIMALENHAAIIANK